jgi:hypothetical protein
MRQQWQLDESLCTASVSSQRQNEWALCMDIWESLQYVIISTAQMQNLSNECMDCLTVSTSGDKNHTALLNRRGLALDRHLLSHSDCTRALHLASRGGAEGRYIASTVPQADVCEVMLPTLHAAMLDAAMLPCPHSTSYLAGTSSEVGRRGASEISPDLCPSLMYCIHPQTHRRQFHGSIGGLFDEKAGR